MESSSANRKEGTLSCRIYEENKEILFHLKMALYFIDQALHCGSMTSNFEICKNVGTVPELLLLLLLLLLLTELIDSMISPPADTVCLTW